MVAKLVTLIAAVSLVVGGLYIFQGQMEKGDDKMDPLEETGGITVVPTMRDTITADSSWCGTFQLVWNDMKDNVVKKDIVFYPQEEMAANLNLEEFTEEDISEEYYYKKYGLKTLELKEEIEKGIEEKFHQKSDILDDFDWSEAELEDPNNPDVRRYFFYVMLYRKFEFLKEFDSLRKGDFGDTYHDVSYFGIDPATDASVDEQVNVLYYHSEDDFACSIHTKTNDEVIFCKNPKGTNFKEIYETMLAEASQYEGKKTFQEDDELKIPNLTFNEKREYAELENKLFDTADPVYDKAIIVKALQTIQLELDKTGGKIKSEAGIDMKNQATAVLPDEEFEQPRYFYVDDTFAIFLREEGKEMPYFAGRIEDITKFQP